MIIKHNSLLAGFILGIAVIAASPVYAAPLPDVEEVEDSLGKGEESEINVKNADIAAIVRIFSKKTKRNYILDERVKGKVSIYLPGKVSAEEALNVLDSVLALKGFSSVPISQNLWKIVPAKEAKRSTIPTISDASQQLGSAAMVTRLLTLKYVNPDDVKQLISSLISGDGLVNAYTGTNSLIIIDHADNVKRLVKIVNSIDVPFSNQEMTIIPIKHADAPDIATKLNEILGENDSSSHGSSAGTFDAMRARIREASATRRAASSTQRNAQQSNGGATATTIAARVSPPKIISDERTNSIIVVADEDTTARVRALISQLDSPIDLSGFRFYVYRCQHASAEDLADVLSGLTGGSGSGTSSRSSSSTRNSSSSQSSTLSRLTGQQRTPGQSRNTAPQQSGVTNVSFGENVSVTADPSTNSLIIHSGRDDYLKLKTLLEELDIKRRQVLVEAMLLEVAIDESVDLGTDFLSSAGGADGGVMATSNFGNNLTQLLSDPTQLSNFSVAAATSGSLTLPGDIVIPTQTVLLTAAQNNQNVNVLSAPTILATDNEQAEIVVGQNVPFLASTATSGDNLNNTFNQIDRQDVGITLRITPQISSGDTVSMTMFTEVSNVISATLNSDLGPTTTVRTSETTVITKDGQMVVIGGLMSDDITESKIGVPFLQDLPFLGHLFGQVREEHRRKNLLMFITPRIVKDQFDLRDVTLSERGELEGLIEREGIQPPRHDVLRSMDMDRVSESEDYKGPKPSTIRPPHRKTAAEANLSEQLTAQQQQATGSSDGETLELEIEPVFPELEQTEPGGPRARFEPGSALAVLKVVGEDSSQGRTPFRTVKSGQAVTLTFPAHSNQALSFFTPGQRVFYEVDSSGVTFEILGIAYDTADINAIAGSDISGSFELSPFELMGLGNGPWKRLN